MSEGAPVERASVESELTFADLLAFQVAHFCTSAQGRRARRVGQLFILGSGLLLAFGAHLLTDPSSWVLLAIVATALLGALLYPRQFIKSITKRLDKDLSSQRVSHLLGPQRVELAAAGLRVSDERGEREWSWKEVLQVSASNTHLYLYVEPAWAVIVPHRDFADDAAGEAFAELAVSRVERAHHE